MSTRKDGRTSDQLRPLTLTSNYLPQAEGSCLVELGNTRVIVTASVEKTVPAWLAGKGTGWVTAEYGMLPRSTHTRNRRASSSLQLNGRTMEIQRLIGRSLRAVSDFRQLGERTIYIDCDVISADGGTRAASIIGATVALHDANSWLLREGYTERSIMTGLVGAVSIGIRNGETLVDLTYEEDSSADVDMNVVMTDAGKLVEVQGTAEHGTFGRDAMNDMLDAAERSIRSIIAIQREALSDT
ncbi:MAG: ribonuclease PH [Candidatus Latescibacterota bacterium]